MSAPIGNKNAEKYTLEWIQEELLALLLELHDNKEIVYIGELFEEKEYSRSRFWEWCAKYQKDSLVSCTHKKIKDILETRAVIGGMKNNLNTAMTIFHLKNNYKWRDKQELDVTERKQIKEIEMI